MRTRMVQSTTEGSAEKKFIFCFIPGVMLYMLVLFSLLWACVFWLYLYQNIAKWGWQIVTSPVKPCTRKDHAFQPVFRSGMTCMKMSVSCICFPILPDVLRWDKRIHAAREKKKKQTHNHLSVLWFSLCFIAEKYQASLGKLSVTKMFHLSYAYLN